MQPVKTNKTLSSFANAFSGLFFFFRHERNGKVQSIIALLTIIAGTILPLSSHEWIAIILCISAVLSAEVMNSALEKLCDHLQPLYDNQIKIIKDVAAGAVLFISIASAIIGVIIFLPKIWPLL